MRMILGPGKVIFHIIRRNSKGKFGNSVNVAKFSKGWMLVGSELSRIKPD